MSCRLSGSRWSHILNHRLHLRTYLTSSFALFCVCVLFFSPLLPVYRICCCIFLTCSHRLTDLIQSPWIIPLHLESTVTDEIEMGTIERSLMIEKETN